MNIFSKLSVKSAVLIAVVLSTGLLSAPRQVDLAKADDTCSPLYQTPTFNPYPAANTGGDCTDYSFMRARVYRDGQVIGTYAPGDVNAQAGDEVDVVLYIHNGAVQNGDPNVTTMKGIQLSTNADMSASASHSISANVTAANASNSLNGSININTSGNTSLQVAPGSELWAARDSGYAFQNFSGVVNSTKAMPDQQACFNYIRFVYFTFKVVAAAPAPVTPSTFTATATASASASATATCPSGITATASASASATATATSSVSQADAQSKAQNDADSKAQAQAHASAQAQATVSCPAPVTPATLICKANPTSAAVLETVTMSATGGNGQYTWSTSNNSNAGSGNVFNVAFASAGNKTVSVKSSDGQTANCNVTVNAPAPSTFTATATSSATATAACPNGDGLTGSANASATSTSSISQADAQSKAQASADTQAKAQAQANADAKIASCPAAPATCSNDKNSCNTNTNTVTQTNGNGSNNANQSNINNVNGDNNTIVNTNNNCVNNSCNTVYINNAGTTVPAVQHSQLTIAKSVRTLNSGSYGNSVNVNTNQIVQFQIVVSNSGSQTANNVRVTDTLPSGLSLVYGTATVNGNAVSDYSLTNGMILGNLTAGQQATVTFQAYATGSNGASIQNNASASADNADTVQSSAWVFINGTVLGGNVNLTYSKTAINNTKNTNATTGTASREDFITYTLTVANSGNAAATNFIVTDDLSQVLPYADITDYGGSSLNGNVISFPGITIPAGGSVTRSFQVRVKNSLAENLSYVMTNTYGNTVTIRINTPQVLGAFTAPTTGADTLGFMFSGVLTAGAALVSKRKALMKLIFS